MTHWRPTNWNEIKNREEVGRHNIHYCGGFEDGADAMLEALRGKGKWVEAKEKNKIENITDDNLYFTAIKPGVLVFIPDDEGRS